MFHHQSFCYKGSYFKFCTGYIFPLVENLPVWLVAVAGLQILCLHSEQQSEGICNNVLQSDYQPDAYLKSQIKLAISESKVKKHKKERAEKKCFQVGNIIFGFQIIWKKLSLQETYMVWSWLVYMCGDSTYYSSQKHNRF